MIQQPPVLVIANARANINKCNQYFNIYILFFRCKSLQTPANMLIINLAVSDFIMLAKASV